MAGYQAGPLCIDSVGLGIALPGELGQYLDLFKAFDAVEQYQLLILQPYSSDELCITKSWSLFKMCGIFPHMS